jgi:hypothetical protein
MPLYLSGNRIDKEPNLLFDKSDSSAVYPQVYWGLRRYGPYDKEISRIRLVIISPETGIDRARRLVDELNEGTPILPGGMPKFFECNIDVLDEVLLDSTDTDSYENKSLSFVRSSDPRGVDVVLVYIPRKTSRYFSNTPYYRTKAILASEGYPSQVITDFTFDNLKWSYLNLASAIFSKAGGIPWVLESEMKNTDIVLGISISNVVSKKHRAGDRPRYVGIVNVFDSYGKWMFFEGTAKLYDRAARLEQLKELFSKALERFKSEKKFYPKNVIIHYYKRFGRKEIEYINMVLKDLLGDYNVAFVSIDDSHPFRLYDKSVTDGSFPRGYYAYLSENSILLSTTGFTTMAARRMGTPRLLHIVLRQSDPKFIGIDDVALQVLSLTKLDWATATPLVREPITLQFSRAIAYMTAAISEQEWQSITRPEVNVILSKRPWFI